MDAAVRAGSLLRAELGGRREIRYKDSPANLVTEMDRRAEALIVGGDPRALSRPQHPRRGARERWPARPRTAGSSIRSTAPPTTPTACPIFAVSIALEVDGPGGARRRLRSEPRRALRGRARRRRHAERAPARACRRIRTLAREPPRHRIPVQRARPVGGEPRRARAPQPALPQRARDRLRGDPARVGGGGPARRVLGAPARRVGRRGGRAAGGGGGRPRHRRRRARRSISRRRRWRRRTGRSTPSSSPRFARRAAAATPRTLTRARRSRRARTAATEVGSADAGPTTRAARPAASSYSTCWRSC